MKLELPDLFSLCTNVLNHLLTYCIYLPELENAQYMTIEK